MKERDRLEGLAAEEMRIMELMLKKYDKTGELDLCD